MKTVAFKTLGCKVNQYETQAIREQFMRAGFREILDGPADIYVINTCTVTAATDSKSRQLIRAFHRLNPEAMIVATGCYVERDRAEVEAIKGVNFIIRNDHKNDIVKIIQESRVSSRERNSYLPLRISGFFGHTRAFLKVQDGCNRCCSYCKVRIVRGRSRSRDIDDIVEEAKRLAGAGFKEIVLSGIQLGSYGQGLEEGADLCSLIGRVEPIEGIQRIRLSSIEPMDVTDRLIKIVQSSDRLCRHLHIPLQSGDDSILARMRRGYRARDFEALIRKIRRSVKQVSITTDVMVGFPGEEDLQFRRTLELVRRVIPNRVHIFPYSRREGTEAARLMHTVSPEEIKERVARLKEIALSSSFIYRKQFLGHKVDVLVESKPDQRTKLLCGYTDTYIKILLDGPEGLMNQIVPVEVTEVKRDYTAGQAQF